MPALYQDGTGSRRRAFSALVLPSAGWIPAFVGMTNPCRAMSRMARNFYPRVISLLTFGGWAKKARMAAVRKANAAITKASR